MPWREIHVSGRVQGVGFRAFVAGWAGEVGATGEVWNDHNGGVVIRVYLQSSKLLDEFTDKVRRGPGRVDRLNSLADEEGPASQSFQVGPTR